MPCLPCELRLVHRRIYVNFSGYDSFPFTKNDGTFHKQTQFQYIFICCSTPHISMCTGSVLLRNYILFYLHVVFLFIFYLSLDTRETSFVSAITAAGVTYAVTRACTMGDLVECSCDKNRILRRLHYSTSDGNSNDDTSITSTAIISHGQEQRKRERRGRWGRGRRQRHRSNKNNDNIDDNLLRNRNIYRNVVLPDGDWEWGGCGDNVNFGFRKSKDFLDSRYRRRSDIKTLVKLHNNNAGRLVSMTTLAHIG